MPAYRRIVCAIEPSRRNLDLLHRAFSFARKAHAELAVAAVVDYQPGFESDHYPFLTPNQVREQTLQHVSDTLSAMVAEVRSGPAEILVADGDTYRTLVDMAASWRADLVIVGSNATMGLLDKRGLPWGEREPLSFDVLALETRSSPLERAGRLIRALVPSF